jgi:hypothetical protein
MNRPLRWKPINKARGASLIDQHRAWALDWMCSLETQCKELGLPLFQVRLWEEISKSHDQATDAIVHPADVSLHRCMCVMAHVGLNVISEDQFRRKGIDSRDWKVVVADEGNEGEQ